MKTRYRVSAISGLAAALLFLSVPAGAAPPPWAHAPAFLAARLAWQTAAGQVSGADPVAPVASGGYPWPEEKVVAGDWTAGDLYGYSSAITSDMAFVGAPGATVNGNVDEGAVYVYRKENGVWTQMQKITPGDGGAYDEFGISIAASGNQLLVGSVGHGGTGVAYVFTLTGGSWRQDQEFTADDAVGFGYVVALNDGTAVVGAPGVDGFSGAAYVFRQLNGAWSQTAELTASDGAAGAWFGQSVAISGNTIIVGQVPQAALGGFSVQGAAYVFTKTGSGWMQTQRLTASDGGIGDFFGDVVTVSGSTALISAPIKQVGAFNFGAVYVFTRSGGIWSQTQRLIGSNITGPNQFGNSVALHGDAAVIGVPAASFGPVTSSPSLEGAVYVFARTGGRWTREKIITASDASPGEIFGFAVGVAANGIIATTIPDYGGGAGPDAGYIYGPVNLGVTANTP